MKQMWTQWAHFFFLKNTATGNLKVEGALSNHTAVTGFYLQAKLPGATCPRQKAVSIRASSHSTHTHRHRHNPSAV